MQVEVENITLFTDASFCNKTKAAGGAFWARNHAVKARGAFVIEDARKTHESEIIATARAILMLKNHPELGPVLARGESAMLIVVVDCLDVKRVLEGRDMRLDAAARRVVKRVRAFRDSAGFLLKVNYVQSHKGVDTPRQWVNAWCNREARRHMKELREKRIRDSNEGQDDGLAA